MAVFCADAGLARSLRPSLSMKLAWSVDAAIEALSGAPADATGTWASGAAIACRDRRAGRCVACYVACEVIVQVVSKRRERHSSQLHLHTRLWAGLAGAARFRSALSLLTLKSVQRLLGASAEKAVGGVVSDGFFKSLS